MKCKLHSYRVTGRGHFPLDMLRYDSAWPATTQSVVDLVAHEDQLLRPRSIELYSHRAPTEGRWNSFNWTVSGHDYRTLS